MPLFRVKIRGENFLLNLGGEPQMLGFDVVHFVEAATPDEASQKAVIRTRQSRHLRENQLSLPNNPSTLNCVAVDSVWWRRRRQDGRYEFWPAE